ncbi:YgjP-like metallopeptidase domain-containing protein [Oscillospiraceae bacterium 50-16]
MVREDSEQTRTVDTPQGPLAYVLVRKPVKNLNLRVCFGEKIMVSIPRRCSVERADDFVREKSGWVWDILHRQESRREISLPSVSPEECGRLLREALLRVYPLVEPLGVAFPVLKLRLLKSQWGNCHWNRGYITLNTALARCPEELRDYVALHELLHFLHHDHGSGFYAKMDALMPDWRTRRQALQDCGKALDQET